MNAPVLVIGANGFLGSHVTRKLVTAGEQVRVMVRPTANTISIDGLDVTRYVGDVFDTDTVRAAMTGCRDVYYCVVDTRAWLRDPAPLFATNVEGLRNVLDVAVEPEIAAGLRRFVFTSSYVTVGRRRGAVATEAGRADPAKVTPYVASRVAAEDLVLDYAARHGLPAVAMCVATTYGDGDWGRTPHGAFIAGAVYGKLPFVMAGVAASAVGVDDAAAAMLAAAERGRNGQRYLIADRLVSNAELVRVAAEEAGVAPPSRTISVPTLWALGALGSLRAALTGRDAQLSLKSVQMMRAEVDVDTSKAARELGWTPAPVEQSIRAAARFWLRLRDAKRNQAAA